jgi:hypothetical protein
MLCEREGGLFTETCTQTQTMNAIQREYLRNARKAVRIASDVKFNAVAYNAQVSWAEAYWHNYLKSVGTKQFMAQMNRLKDLLARKDTHGALRYLETHV